MSREFRRDPPSRPGAPDEPGEAPVAAPPPPASDVLHTLHHDPDDPMPWDAQPATTLEFVDVPGTEPVSEFGALSEVPGSRDVSIHEAPVGTAPSVVELASSALEDAPPEAEDRAERARVMAVGLLLGAAIGLLIDAILSRWVDLW